MEKFKNGRELLKIAGVDGTFDYSSYDHGMYNGMEFMLSLIEGRQPEFRDAPKKWLEESKIEVFLRKIFRVPKYKITCEPNGTGNKKR